MTFNNLHDGLDGCNCLEQEGVSENTDDFFARAIVENELSVDDFKSYHEIGKLPRYELKACRDKCRWRGISVNKLAANEAEIKAKWRMVRLFAPQGTKNFVCTFRFKVGAGKVWDTSNKHPDAHHDFLKSDEFNLASVEVKEVVPFADF